jgi:hypothetical protein
VPRPRDRKDDALLRLRNAVLDSLETTQSGASREAAPARLGPEERLREIAASVPLAARTA